MSAYRPEFLNALTLLAEAFQEVAAAGYEVPVLVGGAAVEFYTAGAVASGDFDVITAAQQELERALIERGVYASKRSRCFASGIASSRARDWGGGCVRTALRWRIG